MKRIVEVEQDAMLAGAMELSEHTALEHEPRRELKRPRGGEEEPPRGGPRSDPPPIQGGETAQLGAPVLQFVARRPKPGTLGQPAFVKSNFSPIGVGQDDLGPRQIYQYALTLCPLDGGDQYTMKDGGEGVDKLEKLPAYKRKEILLDFQPQIEQALRGARWAWDGDKIMFTASVPLPGGEEVGGVAAFRRRGLELSLVNVKRFELTLGEGESDEHRRALLQVVDVALQMNKMMTWRKVGRASFNPAQAIGNDIFRGTNKLVWMGIKQTVVQAGGKPMLLIDKGVTTVLRPTPVIDFLCVEFGLASGGHGPRNLSVQDLIRKLRDRRAHQQALDQIKSKKVTHRHPQYTEWVQRWQGYDASGSSGAVPCRPITGLSDESAAECMFAHNEWGTISVLEFFRRQYGIKLEHPQLPCVGFGGKGRNKVPMELCEFVGGEPQQINTADDRAKIVSLTSEAPRQRLTKIEELKAQVGGDDTTRAFGINVGGLIDRVPARTLAPMKIAYGNKHGGDRPCFQTPEVTGRFRGGWRMEPSAKYRVGSKVRCIVGLFPKRGEDLERFLPWETLMRLLEQLRRTAEGRGVILDFGALLERAITQ